MKNQLKEMNHDIIILNRGEEMKINSSRKVQQSTTNRTIKRKHTKKRSKAFVLTMTVMVLVSLFCIYSIMKEINTTFSLKSQISQSTTLLKNLKSEKSKLKKEKKNLEDPDYLVRYARGKYMVTKNDGEQVFKLPDN